MSFLANFFQRKQNNISSEQDKTFTIPPRLTAAELSTVQLTMQSKKLWSVSCILLSKPIGTWEIALGLDSSYSMRDYYGKGIIGMPPAYILKEYQKLGELEQLAMDGDNFLKISPSAMIDLEKRGLSKRTENIIDPLTQKLLHYFINNICETVAVDYYSCGEGNALEKVGSFTKDNYEKINLTGPDQFTFGKRSKLMPFITNFAKGQTKNSAICFMITDGIITDWAELKNYSKTLSNEIFTKKRNPLKFILLVVGEEIPEALSRQVSSLNEHNSYVLWELKVVNELRSLAELFSKVNGEEQIVADSGIIYDDKNNILREYKNGLPTKIEFTMSVEADEFSIMIGDKVIRQKIPMRAYHLKD